MCRSMCRELLFTAARAVCLNVSLHSRLSTCARSPRGVFALARCLEKRRNGHFQLQSKIAYVRENTRTTNVSFILNLFVNI